jgi:hypothetical protein
MIFNSHACLTCTQRITKNCLKLLSTNIETARQIISLMLLCVCVCVCVFFSSRVACAEVAFEKDAQVIVT